MREKCLSQEHNAVTQVRLGPGLVDPECIDLTIRSTRPHSVFLIQPGGLGVVYNVRFQNCIHAGSKLRQVLRDIV